MNKKNPEAFVYIDDQCYLCNYWVSWIMRKDTSKRLEYNSLYELYPDTKSFDSIEVFYQGNIYRKSDAIILIAQILGMQPLLFNLLKNVPKRIRNYVYDGIALYRNRIVKNDCGYSFSFTMPCRNSR